MAPIARPAVTGNDISGAIVANASPDAKWVVPLKIFRLSFLRSAGIAFQMMEPYC